MAERGGKGLSLPKGGKTALKSLLAREEPLKEKHDSPAKSRKGRNVYIDSDVEEVDAKISVTPKVRGKASTPVTQGDWGKRGKGGKIASAGKDSVSKYVCSLELNVDEELPKNAKCLMDCEAAHVLKGIQEQMVILSEDPSIKLPLAFDSCLQHAKAGSHYTRPRSVRPVLESLKNYGITDGEMCIIANICPESVEDTFALISSLKDKSSRLRVPLRNALSELALLKRSDAK